LWFFISPAYQRPKKFWENRTFSQYFASFLKINARKQFQALSQPFTRLSTVIDRQITPQFTTFQQPINPSQQVIHRVFLRRQIVTFTASGSTISIPQNLWQNLATSVRNACPRGRMPQGQTDWPRTLVDPIDLMSEVTMNSTVCLLTELPESLHGALKTYLDRHPEWDQDRAIAAALSLFLMQNNNDGNAARVYLNTLFSEAV
jgi:hypothetical protein